jgi:hypothetical protein
MCLIGFINRYFDGFLDRRRDAMPCDYNVYFVSRDDQRTIANHLRPEFYCERFASSRYCAVRARDV